MAGSFAALRIRPAALPVSANLSDDRLRELGAEISGGPTETGTLDWFHFDPPSAEGQAADELALWMRPRVGATEAVVIDLRFSTETLRSGLIDLFLGAVLRRALSAVTQDHRVLILCTDIPASVDELWRSVAGTAHPESIVFLNSTGTAESPALSGAWQPSEAVIALGTVDAAALRTEITRRLLRRRGVFRVQPASQQLSPYRYSGEPCSGSLKEYLTHYLDDNHVELVLYDTEGGAWLGEAVRGACTGRAKAFALRDLDPDDGAADPTVRQMHLNLTSALQDAPRICLTMSLVKSGRAMSDAVRSIRENYDGHIGLLATMLDANRFDDVRDEGPIYRARGRIADSDRTIDFIAPVEQDVLTHPDWRVAAAELADEIEEPDENWTRPSMVGLWTLFGELGIGSEAPTPQRRVPEPRFPNLAALDEWDDLWLAESLVRVAESNLGVSRSQLVMVFPDEPSGARPLAQAMQTRLDVAVLTVQRGAIEGTATDDGFLQSIHRYHDHRIIAADESTVTYSSFLGIDRLVKQAVGREIDLGVVVVELSETRLNRPTWLRSLYAWQPFHEADGR